MGYSTKTLAEAPCQPKSPTAPFPEVQLRPLAKGLKQPVGLYAPGDGRHLLFALEQPGVIRILKNGQQQPKAFLDIRDRVSSGGEKGLLGLAFHPGFKNNHRFFVNYTSASGGLHTVISEFRLGTTPDVADPKSERRIMRIDQPYSNHNGGQIAFGPDGYLYIGTGDGGSGNDPHGNAQSLSTLLGKMLRIDIDGKSKDKAYAIPPDNPFTAQPGALPEIWAYGLRNPWRFSFDSVTGLLYAADVGQSDREEINIIRSGRNYGWNRMEGTICTPGVNPRCNRSGLELPILDYPRSQGTTVIGGHVYRGRAIAGLCGAYLYADYGSGRIWALRYDGRSVTHRGKLMEGTGPIVSFGEDESGELYVVSHRGKIHRIIPSKTPDKRPALSLP